MYDIRTALLIALTFGVPFIGIVATIFEKVSVGVIAGVAMLTLLTIALRLDLEILFYIMVGVFALAAILALIKVIIKGS